MFFFKSFYFKELQDLRTNGVRAFRDITVDDSNILYWQGLIVPVSGKLFFVIFMLSDTLYLYS